MKLRKMLGHITSAHFMDMMDVRLACIHSVGVLRSILVGGIFYIKSVANSAHLLHKVKCVENTYILNPSIPKWSACAHCCFVVLSFVITSEYIVYIIYIRIKSEYIAKIYNFGRIVKHHLNSNLCSNVFGPFSHYSLSEKKSGTKYLICVGCKNACDENVSIRWKFFISYSPMNEKRSSIMTHCSQREKDTKQSKPANCVLPMGEKLEKLHVDRHTLNDNDNVQNNSRRFASLSPF